MSTTESKTTIINRNGSSQYTSIPKRLCDSVGITIENHDALEWVHDPATNRVIIRPRRFEGEISRVFQIQVGTRKSAIPADICDKLGIESGDVLEWTPCTLSTIPDGSDGIGFEVKVK